MGGDQQGADSVVILWVQWAYGTRASKKMIRVNTGNMRFQFKPMHLPHAQHTWQGGLFIQHTQFKQSPWAQHSQRPHSRLSTVRRDNDQPDPPMLKPKHTYQTLIQVRGFFGALGWMNPIWFWECHSITIEAQLGSLYVHMHGQKTFSAYT